MQTAKIPFNRSFFQRQIVALSALLFSATINALSCPSLQQVQEEKKGQWQFKYYAINQGKFFRSDLEYNNHPSSFVFLTRTPIAFNHDWFDGCILHCVYDIRTTANPDDGYESITQDELVSDGAWTC